MWVADCSMLDKTANSSRQSIYQDGFKLVVAYVQFLTKKKN